MDRQSSGFIAPLKRRLHDDDEPDQPSPSRKNLVGVSAAQKYRAELQRRNSGSSHRDSRAFQRFKELCTSKTMRRRSSLEGLHRSDSRNPSVPAAQRKGVESVRLASNVNGNRDNQPPSGKHGLSNRSQNVPQPQKPRYTQDKVHHSPIGPSAVCLAPDDSILDARECTMEFGEQSLPPATDTTSHDVFACSASEYPSSVQLGTNALVGSEHGFVKPSMAGLHLHSTSGISRSFLSSYAGSDVGSSVFEFGSEGKSFKPIKGGMAERLRTLIKKETAEFLLWKKKSVAPSQLKSQTTVHGNGPPPTQKLILEVTGTSTRKCNVMSTLCKCAKLPGLTVTLILPVAEFENAGIGLGTFVRLRQPWLESRDRGNLWIICPRFYEVGSPAQPSAQ